MNSLVFVLFLFFNNLLNPNVMLATPITYPTPPTFAPTSPMTPPIFPTNTFNPPTPPVKNSHSSNHVYFIEGGVVGAVVFFVTIFTVQSCLKSIKEHKKNTTYERVEQDTGRR